MLTADEVCGMLKVSKDWLYDVCQNGTFPVLRLGRQLRFDPDEVRAYLDGYWEVEPEDSRRRRGRR